jgi:hypothetical protein
MTRLSRIGQSAAGRPRDRPAYPVVVSKLFHVSSVLNRKSIMAHGLDWSRMGSAPGIAGSQAPEQQAIFLCRDEFEADFFVTINNTGGPVDVWAVEGIEEEELIVADTGFCYLPARIPPGQLTLCEHRPRPREECG